jgi:hypothetical protein
MPYPALNSAFDALVPPGLQHYWKANFVRELTDDVIEAHVEHGSTMPNVNSTVHLYPIDGACHRVGPDETAFGHRDASFAPVIAGMWPDAADNDKNIKWVRDYYKQQPRTRRRVDTSTSPPTMIRVVSLQTTARITASSWVKRKYDPDNLFHMNQNIDPKG